MRILAFTFTLVFAASGAWATRTKKAPAKKVQISTDKISCGARELELRNCFLRFGETRLSLLKDRWRFHDGQWLSVQDLPLKSPEVEWEKITIEQFKGRRLLQAWLWSPPTGESGVQNLTWFVIELGERDSPVRVQEVVRRRRQVLPEPMLAAGEAARAPAAVQKQSKPKYSFDPLEKTDIRLKDNEIEWKSGQRHGKF